MITMDMLGKVRRMKMREKLTISEIAKRTGLARNTVKRWLNAPGDISPKYLRQSNMTKLSDYEETLIMALKVDAHRHKGGRRTARALFVQIRAQGYRGGYSAECLGRNAAQQEGEVLLIGGFGQCAGA